MVDPDTKNKINEEINELCKHIRKANTRKKLDNVVNNDDPALIKKKFWSFFKATSNSCRIRETIHYGAKFRSNNLDIGNLFKNICLTSFQVLVNMISKLISLMICLRIQNLMKRNCLISSRK